MKRLKFTELNNVYMYSVIRKFCPCWACIHHLVSCPVSESLSSLRQYNLRRNQRTHLILAYSTNCSLDMHWSNFFVVFESFSYSFAWDSWRTWQVFDISLSTLSLSQVQSHLPSLSSVDRQRLQHLRVLIAWLYSNWEHSYLIFVVHW